MSKPSPDEIEEKRRTLDEALAREEARRRNAVENREKFYGLQVEPDVSYYDDAPRREPGDGNWVGYGFDLHPQVSVASAAILTIFVALTLGYQVEAQQFFSDSLAWIARYFGWLYILTANVILVAMVVFAFGRYGKVRIGGPDARPEFSDFGWYSMLISAGMGIGLMFWSIAEPMMHLAKPSPMFGVTAGTPEAAQAAFAVTYYHWGLHPWAIYSLVGLALAFFAFNRGLPLTIRSVFYPLLGERIYGWWGNAIDTLSVMATLCGLATSLGLGVNQVAAGLDFLGPLPRGVREFSSVAPEATTTVQVGAREVKLRLSPETTGPLAAGDFVRADGGPTRKAFESFRGRLVAPLEGQVESVEVAVGDDLSAGRLVAVIDGKPVRLFRDGKVQTVDAAAGARIDANAPLVTLEELDEERAALAQRWRAVYRAWKGAGNAAEKKAWMAHLGTIEKGLRSQPSTVFLVILIAVITGFATMSVVAGLDEGVQRLSEINIYLAAGMMLFLLFVGPTVFIVSSFAQNLGFYIQSLPQMSLWTEAFRDTSWQSSWTLFYWGWWISWSPFVGMFIARISKGRTVREFILGVMLVPSMLSFFWMSVFGGTAIHLQTTGAADVAAAVDADVSTALFEMLRSLPFTGAASLLGICLVTFFFVTSSDSGSLVVDHLTSGGKLDSPVPQRVFWACMEGLLAAVLLLGGGLAALQTASIASGLPFALILLVMIYSLRKDLLEELFQLDAASERAAAEEELAKHKAVAAVAVHEHVALVEERQAAERDLEQALEEAGES